LEAGWEFELLRVRGKLEGDVSDAVSFCQRGLEGIFDIKGAGLISDDSNPRTTLFDFSSTSLTL
jgi:hypothetical protein